MGLTVFTAASAICGLAGSTWLTSVSVARPKTPATDEEQEPLADGAVLFRCTGCDC
jgi:hypothetical protein